MSLIPIAVTRNEDRRYHPASDSEDTFDPITILRNRLERGNPTVATRRALEIMDAGGRPALNESVGGAVEAPVKVVISGPDSPVEDWSNDFELGSSSDVNVSILFPSASDRSLLDEVEQDSVSSPMLPKFSVKFPSTPVLDPVTLVSPCSPFTLGTPALSTNWEDSRSSISTLMAESPPPSPISSPANMSFDEEEMARIMHTVLSRTRHPFSGSPEGDVDVTTVMRVEIASTLPAGRARTLIGLGVAMPVIYPPLPPTLFPLHHPPGTALNSRRVFSLQGLGYRSFDDRMFEIEQTSSDLLSRNVHEPSELSGFSFEINESLLYSPLEGCTAPTPLLPEVDFDCSDAFQIEQTLSQAHTTINHTSPIAFGKALIGLGLGLDVLTEASIESHSLAAEPSPSMQKYSQSLKYIINMDQILIGRHSLVSANESVAEGEVALPLVSDFYLQAQKSFNFEPSGVQKTIELDASQLERHSALYNLEHSSDLLLEHIFSHSPPIQPEKKTEIERQLLANLFKEKSRHHSKMKRNIYKPSKMFKKLGLERLAIFQPRSGRDDLDLTSPTITPQDDPRSPNLSTLDRVFLTFSSIKPSEMPSPVKMQFSGSVPKSEVSSKANKNMQIGLGLPSPVLFRRKLRQQVMSQEVDAVRCRSRSSSQECPNYSFIVTEPSFGPSYSRVQSVVESSNQFLKPSQFTERSLYDIVEVPTPPSSTSSSPRGTPSSSRSQWSSPFIRLNPPQKRKSFRTQLSAPSTGSAHDGDTEVSISMDPSSSAEFPKAPAVTTARPGFKRYVSKFRDLFKRSRSLKTSSSVSSPVLIEHPDAAPRLELLRQDDNHDHGVSCAKENGLASSISAYNLQLLF